MKNITYLLILVLFLSACQNECEEILGKAECSYQKSKKSIKETISFSEATRIEAIHFEQEPDYDKRDALIEKGKFPGTIYNSFDLNLKQKEQLFSILYDYTFTEESSLLAMCYEPHHSFRFYKNDQQIAYFEICFECSRYEHSDNLEIPFLCGAQWCMLEDLLREIGIQKGFNEDSEMVKNKEQYCDCLLKQL